MPYITKDGVNLFYVERGSGEPSLLFIHGLGGTSLHWRKQVDYFSGNHRVVAIDLPGFGRSDSAASHSVEECTKAVDFVANSLSLLKPVLVGHSMGGWITLHYNVLFPGKARALVIVDSFVGFANSPFTKELSRILAATLEGKRSFRALMRKTADSMFAEGGDARLKKRIREDYITTSYDAYRGMLTSILDKIREIFPARRIVLEWNAKIPTLIVYRQADKDRDEVNSLLARHVPNVRIKKVGGVGHYIMIDAEDTFNDILSQFIKELGR